MTFGKPELLAYMRGQKLAVVSSLGPDSQPQGALVGVATTDGFEIVFDTVSTSRKHDNLTRNRRAAVTFSGPGEKTLQYEGLASPVSVHDPDGAFYREAYYAAWPDGRERLSWPNLAYWRLEPIWARYSDFEAGPLIQEFHW